MGENRTPDKMDAYDLLGALQEKVKTNKPAEAAKFIDPLKRKRREVAEGRAEISGELGRLMNIRLEDEAGGKRERGDVEAEIDAALAAGRSELFAALPGPLQQALGGAPPSGGPAERLTLAEAVRYEDAWTAATPAERGIVRWLLIHGGGEEALDPWLRAVLDSLLGQPDRAAGWRDPAVRPDVSRVQPAELDFLTEPPPRKWLVDGLIPAGRLSMLTGEGEVGKSRLLLQIAAGVVREPPVDAYGDVRPELKDLPILPPDPKLDKKPKDELRAGLPSIEASGAVLMLTWEDEPIEIVRRLRMAVRAGAVDNLDEWPKEELGRLLVVNMREGQAGPLWAPQPGAHTSTEGGWTAAGSRVMDLIREHEPALTVIDPGAAGFACNENDRSLVRRFCAAMDAVAEETGSAVIVCAHPPKKDDQVYSGSTDWRNACRALLTIVKVPTGYIKKGSADICPECGKGPKKPTIITAPALVRDKSSYGPKRKPIFLKKHYLSAADAENAGHPKAAQLAWFATTAKAAAAAESGGDVEPAGGNEGGAKSAGAGNKIPSLTGTV